MLDSRNCIKTNIQTNGLNIRSWQNPSELSPLTCTTILSFNVIFVIRLKEWQESWGNKILLTSLCSCYLQQHQTTISNSKQWLLPDKEIIVNAITVTLYKLLYTYHERLRQIIFVTSGRFQGMLYRGLGEWMSLTSYPIYNSTFQTIKRQT